MSKARWNQLTEQQQEEFPPLCPDFVVELRSPSDNLKDLQAKMDEYLANGAQLGWRRKDGLLEDGAFCPSCKAGEVRRQLAERAQAKQAGAA